MADEINPNISIDKTTFIPSLNKDTPSFERSPSYQHIEQTQPRRFSTEDNNNNDSHIEPIQNGNHHENPSNIQLIEPDEKHSTETQFIQETIPINQQPISPSHIQSVNILNDQIFQQSPNEQDSIQINQTSFEQLNTFNTEDQSNLLLIDDETSNIDISFHIQTNIHDKPDELKAQRELDEDEIPPPELSINEIPTNNEINNSPIKLETNIIDNRPLTELETPYEHHHENEIHSVESSIDQTSINNETNIIDNRSLTELDTLYENHHQNEINNFSLSSSSSLPDVVTETFEQNHDDFIPQPIELEKPSIEEILIKNENNIIKETLPPLPPTSIALEQTLETELNVLNKEEQEPLLSNTELTPSKPEDVLGNKTLFKQTIIKGTSNTHPTRSTMATISYTLSLIDNLTSNVRIIENISFERFFIGECDIIPAIDICVQFMDRGERALIDSDIRHCYGEFGCEEKQIPSISSNNSYRMKIDLELHDWKSPSDVQILSIEERLYWGDKKRQMGNFYYRRQDYKTSLQCYHGALRFLDIDDNPILIPFDESQRSILNDRYIQVQNNVAQVNLLLNKYDACLNAVENVLRYDPKNVKALFRQGKALFELGIYDKAIQPLKLFNQIQKGNSNIGLDKDKVNEMINICENKLAKYQKNEKEIYRRMFQTTTNSTVNQQHQTKTNNQITNTNNNWWPYIALGSAVLATIGLVTFIKYRKVS